MPGRRISEATDVLIIGAGLAGLNCARLLEKQGISCRLLEAENAVGGRVRTDEHDGFLLDRGFQVLLTAYPETRSTLDFKRLDLKKLASGVLIQMNSRNFRLLHPIWHPLQGLRSLFSTLPTLTDKYRGLTLELRELLRAPDEIFSDEFETTTDHFLEDYGFSRDFIETCLRPFFSGVFLDTELKTSSHLFEFMYRMFGTGRACVPSEGMQAIPRQLRRELRSSQVSLRSRVIRLIDQGVELQTGERIRAKHIVLAVELPAAKGLLDLPATPGDSHSSCTVYFAAPEAPLKESLLVLNAEGSGVISSLCVVSLGAPTYAPAGSHLVAANVVGVPRETLPDLVAKVREQARRWFGSQIDRWEHLRTYLIPHSLPAYTLTSSGRGLNRNCPDWLDLCGDYLEIPSIEGALRSGRRTAERIARKLHSSSEETTRKSAA